MKEPPRCAAIADSNLAGNYESFMLALVADTVNLRIDHQVSRAATMATYQLLSLVKLRQSYEKTHNQKLSLVP